MFVWRTTVLSGLDTARIGNVLLRLKLFLVFAVSDESKLRDALLKASSTDGTVDHHDHVQSDYRRVSMTTPLAIQTGCLIKRRSKSDSLYKQLVYVVATRSSSRSMSVDTMSESRTMIRNCLV